MRASAVALAALAFASPAAASVSLGILGDASRFRQQTGQVSTVGHLIVGWGQGSEWGSRFDVLLGGLGKVPMLGIGTSLHDGRHITPLQIAQGRGDAYLVALNAAISAWGGPIYIRPLAEMNGHWNDYCAYTASGRPKGPEYSTSAFRKAFARIYVLVHGGSAASIDAKLRRLGLPPLGRDLAINPKPLVKVIWNPQGYGSPDLPGNSAQAYYPGGGYVDVVGDDLYDIRGKAEWAAAEALYKAHPSKPFSFPEWGLWGIDDAAFVKAMAEFVKTHRRVELVSYFNSKPASIFDLATKPASRAAYRSQIVPLGG
jgi:hypothetical protein